MIDAPPPSGDGPADRDSPLVAALRAVLRPLARLAVARAAGLGALQRLLKEELVRAAAASAPPGAPAPSQSRISLMTGVHRKDVREILAGAAPRRAAPRASLAETVAARWLADPERRGTKGPRALKRDGPQGFDALVAGVSTDMRPRAVLDEMRRLGLVTLEGEDAAEADPGALRVRLNPAALAPRDPERLLALFADNLADHAATASANLLAPPGAPRALERAVFYDHLSAASVDRLHAEARALSDAALERLNASALALQKADAGAPEARLRFRWGVYFHAAPQGAAPADAPPGGGADGADAEGDAE